MGELKLKIQRMTGSTTAEQSRKDSAEVTKKIKEIGDNISDILDNCSEAIDELYYAYSKVADVKKIDRDTAKSADSKKMAIAMREKNGDGISAVGSGYNHREGYKFDGAADITANISKNGMNRTRKDLSEDESAAWNKEKQRLGEIFAKQGGLADKVASDLKSLSSYGPLTESATKNGYDELRAIFNANGAFGQKWKKVKIAAEWSTGFIKEALNKVVKMYDVGVRATQAFGKRLSGGNFRDNKGEKIDKKDKKETMSEYASKNKVYNDKGNYDISTNRKNIQNVVRNMQGPRNSKRPWMQTATADNLITSAQKESALLDRLYEMAYEDVMNDLADQQYAMESYDAVPGAYEFVDDLGYDPSLDFDV
jgi:hypothetical protein